MTVRIPWLLAVGLTLASPAGLWAQSADQSSQPQPQVQAQQAADPSPEALGVSFARVKYALARDVPMTVTVRRPKPTFRVDIIARNKPFVPSLADTLKVIPWQPISKTGRDYDEIMAMITPPQARPYGAFVNGELLQVALTSVLSNLLMSGAHSLISRGQDAWRSRVEEAIREQVQREFDDFLKAHPDATRPVK